MFFQVFQELHKNEPKHFFRLFGKTFLPESHLGDYLHLFLIYRYFSPIAIDLKLK